MLGWGHPLKWSVKYSEEKKKNRLQKTLQVKGSSLGLLAMHKSFIHSLIVPSLTFCNKSVNTCRNRSRYHRQLIYYVFFLFFFQFWRNIFTTRLWQIQSIFSCVCVCVLHFDHSSWFFRSSESDGLVNSKKGWNLKWTRKWNQHGHRRKEKKSETKYKGNVAAGSS